MPVVSTATPSITSMADVLAEQLSGGASRASTSVVGDRAVAFDWTAGLRPWAGSIFNGVLVDGLSYRTSVVTPSGTPVAKVAPRSPKPKAGSIDSAGNTLDTYAGYIDCTTQELIDTSMLVAAIETVLLDQALVAYCADIAAALTDAALTASGASWADAILAGIGELPSADVAVVSPADLAAILSPSSGFQVGLKDAIPSVFGLGLIPLPGLATGTSYVAKSSALTLFESKDSPSVSVVSAGDGITNVWNVISDLFAAAQLTSPGAAVSVTKTP